MGEEIKRQLKVTLSTDDGNDKTYTINDPASTLTKAQVTTVFNQLISIPEAIPAGDSGDGTTSILLSNSDEKLTVFKNAELVITSREELS